jgi:DNA-binding NtrC family response regulator
MKKTILMVGNNMEMAGRDSTSRGSTSPTESDDSSCKKQNLTILYSKKGSTSSLTAELSEEGYNVETIHGLNELLEKTVTSQISLIIVNIEAIGIPGWDIISMIKKFNNSIPTIIVTEDDSIETERKIRQEGVFFYFVKPFLIEDMKAVIKSAIGTEK